MTRLAAGLLSVVLASTPGFAEPGAASDSADAAGVEEVESPAEAVPEAGSPDPVAPTAVDPTDGDASDDTIVVYGEHLAQQARAKVEQELIDQGYDRVLQRDGYLLFRHQEEWKGEVRVYDDGWVRVRRQPVQFRPPSGSPLGWATCIAVPFCIRAGGQTVSKAKLTGQRRRALVHLDPLSRHWGDRVADLHVDRALADLGDQLEALWSDGVPLDPAAAPLPTPDARKAAILAYWESRTDTLWGDRVRASVEAFIREVVQYSPFAYTEAEIAEFNARRTCDAELDLTRPWDQVMDELEARAGQ